MGSDEHGQVEQPEGLPALPLREGSDAPLRQVPRLLHGSHSGNTCFSTPSIRIRTFFSRIRTDFIYNQEFRIWIPPKTEDGEKKLLIRRHNCV